MASISVNKCFEPRVVIASGNSAVFLSLKRVTFLTSTKIFCLFLTIRKSNLVSLLKNTSDLIKPEVFFNKETRFDFLIEKNKQKSFVEVKNVTLFRDENTAAVSYTHLTLPTILLV